MKEIFDNQEIPIPEGLEQRLSALVDRLEAADSPSLTWRVWVGSIAAAFIAVAFLLIVPQVKGRRELARFEGSYSMVDGQRIDDLRRIKADINEALAMAQVAEASVPARDFASEAERAILQATDDPEMQAVVQRILKE